MTDQHAHCHAHSGAASAAPEKYDNVPDGYTGTVWTCPMHPQVRETSNTSCPICGMALERETVSLNAEDDTSELDSMTRLFLGRCGAQSSALHLCHGRSHSRQTI